MSRPAFANAPQCSYVNEDGWLVLGDEAWTEAEWKRYQNKLKYGVRYQTDEERKAARQKTWREYMRRRRARAA